MSPAPWSSRVLTEEHRAMLSSCEKQQGPLDTHRHPAGHPAGRLAWSFLQTQGYLGHPGHPDGWPSILPTQLSSAVSTLSTRKPLCPGWWVKQEGNQGTGDRCRLGLKPRAEAWPGQGGASMELASVVKQDICLWGG